MRTLTSTLKGRLYRGIDTMFTKVDTMSGTHTTKILWNFSNPTSTAKDITLFRLLACFFPSPPTTPTPEERILLFPQCTGLVAFRSPRPVRGVGQWGGSGSVTRKTECQQTYSVGFSHYNQRFLLASPDRSQTELAWVNSLTSRLSLILSGTARYADTAG